MSFERFGSSDVYIFEHVAGYIECCGCSLTEVKDEEIFGFAHFKTPREALAHLDEHEAAGDDIGHAKRRIRREYELDRGLDTPIEPYSSDPKIAENRRARLRRAMGLDS